MYNIKSCPNRLRKKIQKQLELSPEVLDIRLHDVKDSYKNKKGINIPIKQKHFESY